MCYFNFRMNPAMIRGKKMCVIQKNGSDWLRVSSARIVRVSRTPYNDWCIDNGPLGMCVASRVSRIPVRMSFIDDRSRFIHSIICKFVRFAVRPATPSWKPVPSSYAQLANDRSN